MVKSKDLGVLMLVTYFVIITRVLINNHMNSLMVLLMMMIMMTMTMMLLMDMKTTQMSSQISNWRCKIHNTQK